jgi:hypothetical protein
MIHEAAEPCVEPDGISKTKINADNPRVGNQVPFYTELGLKIFDVVVEHLVRFKYSAAGCKVLATDVKKYDEAFMHFGIEAVKERSAELVIIVGRLIVRRGGKDDFLVDDVRRFPFRSTASITYTKKLLEARIDSRPAEWSFLDAKILDRATAKV